MQWKYAAQCVEINSCELHVLEIFLNVFIRESNFVQK